MTTDPLSDLNRDLEALPKANPLRREATIDAALRSYEEEFPAQPKTSNVADRPINASHQVWRILRGLQMIIPRPRLALIGSTSIAIAAFATVSLWQNGPLQPSIELAGLPTTKQSLEGVPAVQTETLAPKNEASRAPTGNRALEAARLPQVAQQPMADAEFSALATAGDDNTTARRVLPGKPLDNIYPPEVNADVFADNPPSEIQWISADPVVTFSSDVDTASYQMATTWIENGSLPPPDSVRPEEFINSFQYDYPQPTSENALGATVYLTPTPWNDQTQLLHVGVQGQDFTGDLPPQNFVFLVDVSGSMAAQNKLPLLKSSLAMLTKTLRAQDSIALVTYAGSAGIALEPTAGDQQKAILDALGELDSGGSTAGQAGLDIAFDMAHEMHEDGDTTRIILGTDGDFNVMASNADQIGDYIAKKRHADVSISVLGFGTGNLQDAIMQSIAQKGNGVAAYIGSLSDARRALVEDQTSFIPLARDAKFQIEFNPAAVAAVRLIGYQTRALNREDFQNDQVDAGDLGMGHQVTAIFEVAPVGSDAWGQPLRYQSALTTEAAASNTDELGWLKLRWKPTGQDESVLLEQPISADATAGGADQVFAAAIAGWAEALGATKHHGSWTLADAVENLQAAIKIAPTPERVEALDIALLSTSLQ